MRELFIEELESVAGGQPGPVQWNTTMACCEEGPLSGCCWWWDAIEHLIAIEP